MVSSYKLAHHTCLNCDYAPKQPSRGSFYCVLVADKHIVACTGGAVAGLMAGSALVGIGAAALTGGAVLNAIDFPRSPRLVKLLQLCGRWTC